MIITSCFYRKVNDGNFGWRALRLLARRSPHFFVHGNNPINRLPEYLETMIKKIAKDRPVSVHINFKSVLGIRDFHVIIDVLCLWQ